MSDLGAPGGTRPIPNASECHARARVTRDPAAPLHVSSRTRPRRAKAGARAFPETTTDIALPRPPLFLRPRHERRDERPREPLVTTGRRFRERYVAHVLNDALPATKSRSTARHLPRTARASLRSSRSPPLPSHEIPLALHPQAKLSRPSGSGGSPAPSAARTRKPRLKRYVASLPSSAVADAVPADARSTQISPRVENLCRLSPLDRSSTFSRASFSALSTPASSFPPPKTFSARRFRFCPLTRTASVTKRRWPPTPRSRGTRRVGGTRTAPAVGTNRREESRDGAKTSATSRARIIA
jgi:hypothetical protein